jgi:hypothetical protein
MAGDKNPKWFVYGLRPVIIVGVLIFVIYGVRSYVQQSEDIAEIKSNFAFTTGEIIEYSSSGKGRRIVDYKYLVNSIEYTGKISPRYHLRCEVNDLSNCIGKKYKVIYSKRNPEKSYLLCERYGYELFGLRVPSAFE